MHGETKSMENRLHDVMLIYEVNLYVDNAVAEEMAVWMKDHIREMLAFEGFVGATWYQRDPEEGRQRWVVHYQVERWDQVNAYFEHHADAMRQDELARFGGSFSADRRVLMERESFR